MIKILAIAAAVGFAAISAPAGATVLTYTLTGTDSASFTFDTANFVTAHENGPPSYDYLVSNSYISGTFDGSPTTFALSYYATAQQGGFQLYFNGARPSISPIGPQLFAGTIANPTFLTGTFLFPTDFSGATINDQLVISDGSTPSSVPEPASWSMMLVGFLGVGFVVQRSAKRRSALALAQR